MFCPGTELGTMGPVMRSTPRASRGLGTAFLALMSFSVPARALDISNVAVSPGTVVPLGTVVTLTFTVTANVAPLENLKVFQSIEDPACRSFAGYDGYFRITASQPLAVASSLPLSPSV